MNDGKTIHCDNGAALVQTTFKWQFTKPPVEDR